MVRLDDETALIHQPARLRMMTLLYQRGDIGATTARATLDLTAGNLDAHARRLVDAGLIEARTALTRGGFEARYKITARGAAAFERYLAELEAFVATAGVTGGRTPARDAPTPA